MSHRIGSLVAQSPAFALGPDSGLPATSAGVWERTFSPPAHPEGTKFLMLHFTGASLGAGDRLEVVRSADADAFHAKDVFTAADGTSFWSRPVAGNSVVVRFIDGGDGAGQALITEYGQGEGIRNGGNSLGGGNANGDVFMLDASWADPTFFSPGGVCQADRARARRTSPTAAGVMREAAHSAGMFIVAKGDQLSTCSATLIAPDLILTASHCVVADEQARTGSFTLDFLTDASGNRPDGYNPRFYKLTRVVESGFRREPATHGRDATTQWCRSRFLLLGSECRRWQCATPSLDGEEVFVIHHPRGTVKKVSRRLADATALVGGIETNDYGRVILHNCDIDNGSSGSSLLDAAGKIIAVNNWAPGPCNGESLSIIDIEQDFLTEPPPAQDVDVMIVFDRSGSMSLPSHTAGMTKIEHARRAAALFVDLIRKDATHRAGVVTFSTTAASPPGFAGPQPATAMNETT